MKKSTFTFKVFFKALTAVIFLSGFSEAVFAADYYWRVSAADGQFNNLANWETAAGNGVSPATAPGPTDDVYFLQPSNHSTITANGVISFDNLHFSSGSNYYFQNMQCQVFGSVHANGHLYLDNMKMDFYAETHYTFNIGTDSCRITNTDIIFNNSAGSELTISTNDVYIKNGDLVMHKGQVSVINANFYARNIICSDSAKLKLSNMQLIAERGISLHSYDTINLNQSRLEVIPISPKSYISLKSASSLTMQGATVLCQGEVSIEQGTNITASNSLNVIAKEFASAVSMDFSTLTAEKVRCEGATVTVDTLLFSSSSEIMRITSSQFVVDEALLLPANAATLKLKGRLILDSIIHANGCNNSWLLSGDSALAQVKLNTNFNTTNLFFDKVEFSNQNLISLPDYLNLGGNSGNVSWTPSLAAKTYYWIGGSGSWFAAKNWSMSSGGPPLPVSACPPSKEDTVIFDGHSFSSSGQTVLLDKTAAACAQILWTDSLTYGSIQGNKLFVFGSADFSGCQHMNASLILKGTSLNNLLTASSTIFKQDISVDCKPGKYSLFSNIESTESLLIRSGGLVSNGYSLNFSSIITEASNNMPVLDLQGSQVKLSGDWNINDELLYADFSGTLIECRNFISSGQTQQLYYEQLRISGRRIITENMTQHGVYIDDLICEDNIQWLSNSSATVNQVLAAPFSRLELFHSDTLFVKGNIQLNASGNVCATETFTITSHSAPQRVKLMKTGSGQFLTQNVYAEYMHVIGKSLKLVNGVNLGNNTNVILVSLFNPLPRNFYWVNGSGNWTDGLAHWSIGVPGGSPAATNPDGCVPTKFDNVYFDASSFSTSGQTVFVDTNRIDFSNMYWSSAKTPVFSGDTTVQMNCYGSVMFETGMSHNFHGKLFMRGSHQMAYSHAIITNNVALKSPVYLSGGGRYDLLDDLIMNTAAEGLQLQKGHFYTNGYDISFLSTVSGQNQYDIYLRLLPTNSADISGSVIGNSTKGVSYKSEHESNVNFNAAGSQIFMSGEKNIICGTVSMPVQYESFVFPEIGNHGVVNALSERINLSKLEWSKGNARLSGDFQSDTVHFARSANNLLGAGDTLIIKDTLIASATPCNLLSFNSAQSGKHAYLRLPACNAQLRFAAFKDMEVLPLSACSTPLTVEGIDVGNNHNILFLSMDTTGHKLLGRDTAISCSTVPYLLSANIKGQSVAFSWSSGVTSQTISVFNAGDYSVKASYDSSCFLVDTVHVDIIDSVAPSITCLTDTVVSTDPGSCTYLIDNQYYDPLVYDDCGVNKIWYVLSGATTGSDTVNSLNNVQLNSGITTVSWFASDYGSPTHNISSCSFNIEVHDSINPTASSPSTITVSCPGDVPAPDPAVIIDESDNCGTVSVSFLNESSDGKHCPETLTRTYRIEDAAGNSIVVFHTIVIDDQVAPVSSTPQAVMVQCPDDVPAPDTSIIQNISDNCGPVNVTFYSESSDGNHCPETITRMYMLSDKCGNTSFVGHQIVINDTIPPQVSALQSLSVSCKSNIPVPDTSQLLNTDNCGVAYVGFLADISDGNSCPETISRQYVVKDSCDNSSIITQQIIVNDTVAPTAVALADIHLQCMTALPAPDISVVHGTADNCSKVSVSFLADSSNGNACPEIVERYYQLSDDCGNTALVKRRFIIEDTVPPVISAIPAIQLQCKSGIPAPDLSMVSATDNCSAVNITFISDSSDAKSCPETVYRKYRAEDNCGNLTYGYQSIVVQDTIAPTAQQPDTLFLSCKSALGPADSTVIVASDNCSAPQYSYLGQTSDGKACPEVISRRWLVSDECGNTTIVSRAIIINDTIPPSAVALPLIKVQCKSDIPAPDTSGLQGADKCGVAAVKFLSDISDGNNCPEVISRSYAVTDSCGNTAVVTQTIIIQDTIAPWAQSPADVNLQCSSAIPSPDISVVQGIADNCSNVSVSFLVDSSNGNSCPEIVERYYRLSDDCGNTALVKQRFIIEDTVPPVISAIPAIQLQCKSAIPAPDSSIISANDNCGTVAVTFISDSSDANHCPKTVYRKYKAEDKCGNRAYAYQSIIIQDTTAPIVQQPDTLFLSCKSALSPADSSAVVTSDNCSTPQLSYLGQTSDGNVCPEVISRQWLVSDECGNTTTVSRVIVINDTISPSAAALPPINVQCKSNVPPVNTSSVNVYDNCGIENVLFLSESTDGKQCPEIITREYLITDSCGNSSVVQQQIIVHDLMPPAAGFIQDTIVECVTDIPLPNAAVVQGYTDNCGIDTVKFLQDIYPAWNCPDTVFRVYQVLDSCGNTATTFQRIIVRDTVSPQVNPLPDMQAQCLTVLPAPDTSVVIATDNCSISAVSHLNDSVIMNACTGEVIRSYLVSDPCGNSTIAVQKIFIEDTIPPSGSIITPIHISCATNIPLPNPKVVTATDNCGVTAVSFLTDSTDGKSCPETISRSYLITDSCGNTSKIVQQIIIQDTVAPDILNMPKDTSFITEPGKCGAVISWISPQGSDNCQLDTLICSHNNGSYLQAGSSFVSYQAYDQCGNVYADSFLVDIRDNEAPFIHCKPDTILENTPGECGATFFFDFPVANDNCKMDSVFCSHTTGSFFPVGDTVVTFYATDVSGNIDSCKLNVKIVDTEAPMINCPQSFSSCDSIVDFVSPAAVDNCTKAWSFQTDGLVPGSVYPVGITSNTFYATDMHGNMDSCTFTVEVFPSPAISWTMTAISSYGASDGEIEITVHGGTPDYLYHWNTGSDSNRITGLSPGEYVVMVTDSNGCSVMDSIKVIQPQTISEIELPEGISPNGDGMNDYFVIRNVKQVPNNELRIFDRRGEMVYHKQNYNNTWKGENENHEPLAEGTYFVVFKVPDERLTLKGYLYIRR